MDKDTCYIIWEHGRCVGYSQKANDGILVSSSQEFEDFWNNNWEYNQAIGALNYAFKEIAMKAWESKKTV